jgi:DinB superfamily
MASNEQIRRQLVSLLTESNAHMTLEDAVADYPMDHINTVFPNGTYTAWHLLEHIRRTQRDILDFMTDPNYQEGVCPDDYWPAQDARATEADWRQTIASFRRDMQALVEIANDPQTDLDAVIPHGTGQTIFREIVLVADHNAYHTGEFAIMRQVMGTWGKGH